jgi:hypothetical protein
MVIVSRFLEYPCLRGPGTVGRVREFLAEAYLARSATDERWPDAREIARAAGLLARGGQAARLTSWIYLPEDEMGLYLFTAESALAVRKVAASSGLRLERVVEAVTCWPHDEE